MSDNRVRLVSYREVILANIAHWKAQNVPEAVRRWERDLALWDMPAPKATD